MSRIPIPATIDASPKAAVRFAAKVARMAEDAWTGINDLPIADSERKYHWPLGSRPDDHPFLSSLGL